MQPGKDYDVVNKGAIDPSKGEGFESNPGIKPSIKSIAQTPGEKASNNPAARSISKATPFPTGVGYTNKD